MDPIIPQIPRGFRDIFAGELLARQKMLAVIRKVYAQFGFEPLETPSIERVDMLGKYLPESDEPTGGIFSLRDDDERWIALRYDLTAPLSRVVAQYGNELPSPFRRFQIGQVWRMEKPGPGRFREFYQCDFDTVGSASPAADAEVCAVLAATFEALGIAAGDYLIRVNDRKVLNGVMESAGILDAGQRMTALRAIDKLDRVGEDGIRELLGKGRLDPSGDYTKGAGLNDSQIESMIAFTHAGAKDRKQVCANLQALVGDSAIGNEGLQELRLIDELLDSMDLGSDRVVFDPSVVRGLAYYTGPVFEAELTFKITDEDGQVRPFGSVAGGGRYDDLVERFTGAKVPATGASIGIDRLIAALIAMKKISTDAPIGPVVVTVMDRDRLAEYQKMVGELRAAGIRAEMFLGDGGFRKQMKYADKRRAPVVVIAGGDEFAKNEISLKDMVLGDELAQSIQDREEWRKGQPAQISVPREKLVEETKKIISRLPANSEE